MYPLHMREMSLERRGEGLPGKIFIIIYCFLPSPNKSKLMRGRATNEEEMKENTNLTNSIRALWL